MRLYAVFPKEKLGWSRAAERRRNRISAVMLSERSEDRDFAEQNRRGPLERSHIRKLYKLLLDYYDYGELKGTKEIFEKVVR